VRPVTWAVARLVTVTYVGYVPWTSTDSTRDEFYDILHAMPHIPTDRNKYNCIGDDVKAAARRSPNCIRKTKKYVLWNAGINHQSINHCRSSVKNCFSVEISLKSDKRLLGYGPKPFLKWRPSDILNFENDPIWSSGCHRVPHMLLCSNFH